MSLNTMLTRIEESFHAQEETTEKMKRFVSDASHELRTPLAAIHGYAELYKMQRDMPGALERADESIEHIEASSARMTVLVEDLLSLARLDEGRGIDITQQVKLTSVVNDAADDLHALDPDRGITCGQVVLQAGSDMEHPSRLAFQPGTMPDITFDRRCIHACVRWSRTLWATSIGTRRPIPRLKCPWACFRRPSAGIIVSHAIQRAVVAITLSRPSRWGNPCKSA